MNMARLVYSVHPQDNLGWPRAAMGAEMGAAIRRQLLPDAVIVALPNTLTCSNVIKRRFRSPGRSARDEEHRDLLGNAAVGDLTCGSAVGGSP